MDATVIGRMLDVNRKYLRVAAKAIAFSMEGGYPNVITPP